MLFAEVRKTMRRGTCTGRRSQLQIQKTVDLFGSSVFLFDVINCSENPDDRSALNLPVFQKIFSAASISCDISVILAS